MPKPGSRSPPNTAPSTSISASSGQQGEAGSGPSSRPFPAHPPCPRSPPSEGSESWDDSKLSALIRSPPAGERSRSSRCHRLRCRLRSRSLALCAFSSCSSSLCGDPVSRECCPQLGRPVTTQGPPAGAPAGGPQAATGLPRPPSPGCEAGHGAAGSAWWNGLAPRPRAPAASAAPGSTGAGLSCDRAGGRGNDTVVSPGGRGAATPCPAAPSPGTCASPARCAPTCGKRPPVISTGATSGRHPPADPDPPLT